MHSCIMTTIDMHLDHLTKKHPVAPAKYCGWPLVHSFMVGQLLWRDVLL